MAKISAGGATETGRWRRGQQPHPGAPFEMVLCSDGRCLVKALRGDGFTLHKRGQTLGTAAAQAAVWRMEQA